MTARSEQESFSFQAEAVQVLGLVIHSLYSNKEIFLRELVSNASDAIDRLRFETFSSPEMAEDDGPPRIRVDFDKDARTITVADNGIGMSRAEVIEHIGTIAKSGTRAFLSSLTGDQRQDAAMIGQFGVGFYSAFIVAERVVLTTRRAGRPAGEGVRWESDGKGGYTLETAERAAHGTTIVLHLREGEDDLLNEYRLRSIIQKYSDHISLPIVLGKDDTGDAGTPAPVNQAAALWARPRSEISEQEYKDFYRHVTGDLSDPLAWVHSQIEGTYEYTLLLFIPAQPPYDLYIPEYRRGVKLHVKRVFILEDTGQILPSYLRFVRGVVDSSDLPLNVSRELLQGSRAVDNIRNNAVKKVLRLLADLADNDPGKYATFWKEFGGVLKEGIPEDYANRDEIAKLLRFTSTTSATDMPDVSLSDYVGRMKDGQEHIYYLLAPTPAAAVTSPHLEAFRKKDVEVLLLGDTVDNWVVSGLREFDGKRLQSVEDDSSLDALEDETEKEAKEKASTEFADLCGRLRTILAGTVHDVRVSSRLTTSPACIVGDGPGLGFNPAQRLRGTGLPNQPVLEINPQHALVARLNRHLEDPRLADWAHVLYNQAVLTHGARIEDPAAFVARLNHLLVALAEEAGPASGGGEPAPPHQVGPASGEPHGPADEERPAAAGDEPPADS
ncbi:MAG TPA: molecular chaperone HtpG [Streptosporangiaceae bacterium]|nr:molecular chaperone HtpG [Streptosporangiaceae bacterium]